MGKLKSLVSVAQLVLCGIPSIGLFPAPNPMLPCSVSRCLLIQCHHSHKDLGVITLTATILALTYFEHLGYTEFHAKGFLYISSFDYHNPMNWLVLLTLFYRQGLRLREMNNVLKLTFFFPTSIPLSVSLILWDFTPQGLCSPLQWA